MPKIVIDIAKARLEGKRKANTFMLYGKSRAGKTEFSGTFPRPLFISDKGEGGYTTLENMDARKWYEPDRAPVVWPVATNQEKMEAFREALEIRKREPGRFYTIVFDSLTYQTDTHLTKLEMDGWESGRQPDGRKIYNQLALHLRFFMTEVNTQWRDILAPGGHAHVIWTCLATDPTLPQTDEKGNVITPGKAGDIALAGQLTKDRAPGRTDFWWRLEKTDKFLIHTQGDRLWPGGGRDSGKIPSPLPPDVIDGHDLGATFRSFERIYYGESRK